MSVEDEQRAKYPHLHVRFRYNKDGTLTNGIFDNEEYQRRERFDLGVMVEVASRMWIEGDEKATSRLSDYFKGQWGTYPPLPERLKK